MIGNAPEWCTCGAVVRDEGDRWICSGCSLVIRECVCGRWAKRSRKDGSERCIETYPDSDGLYRCVWSGIHAAHGDQFGRTWSTETVTTISQEQSQHHDESISVTSNVRELVRDNTIASRAHYEATRDLFESLENIIKDQETEIRRLRDEQIGALATFLLEYGTIPKPEEGACATAIRVISELTGGESSTHNDQGNDEEFDGDYIPDDYA